MNLTASNAHFMASRRGVAKGVCSGLSRPSLATDLATSHRP